MRGRKPLPTEVKEVQGTLQPCRTNRNEPKPVKKISIEAAAPDTLSEQAKKNWQFVLENEGVAWVAKCDQATLEQYCELWADIRKCDERVRSDGHFIYVKGALREHPAIKLKAKLVPVFRSIASELGLTPASRSRVAAIGFDNPNEDTKTGSLFDFDDEIDDFYSKPN